MSTNRREWIKQGTLATFGLSLSLRSLANEEGLPRTFGIDKGLINLGSNENPYGISPKAKQAIIDMMGQANRYQFNVPALQNFRKQLGAYYKVSTENILVTAGSGEGLNLIARHYQGKGNIVTANPTFGILPSTAKRLGTEVIEVPLTMQKVHDLPAMLKVISSKTALAYVVNPANPTATIVLPAELKEFCREASKTSTVLIDEAYIDYLETPYNESMLQLVEKDPKIMVMGTFSKIHGMAGLRIGYIIAHPTLIKQLEQTYFNATQNCVSNLSMAAALASLDDEEHKRSSLEKNAAARKYIYDQLKTMNYEVYPSYTNFLFFKLKNYPGDFVQDMLGKNIVIRSNAYSDGKWCRVSVGTIDEMKQFTSTLKSLVG